VRGFHRRRGIPRASGIDRPQVSPTREADEGVCRSRIFKLAGVSNGHAHRFRETFATELLLAGVPLERVSVMLGHSSVKVTEKHYSPWVRARQEQLEADGKRTWDRDPLVLAETKGTPEVHGNREVVN
jgi:integrase